MKLSGRFEKFAPYLVGGAFGAAMLAWVLWDAGRGGADPVRPDDVVTLEPMPAPRGGDDGSSLRPSLARALGLGGEIAPDAERLVLLRGLGGDLTPPEVEALLAAFLRERPASAPSGWYAEYLHEIAGAMQRVEPVDARFPRALATLAADPGRELVLRDYAIQHLCIVWDRVGEDSDLRSRIEGSLRELAADSESPACPSALLSLHLLGTTPAATAVRAPGPDALVGADALRAAGPSRAAAVGDGEIFPAAEALLSAPPTARNLSARLVAVRIVGERGLTDLRSALRDIAAGRDPGEHMLARMAAVSALAELGEEPDLAFLRSLSETVGAGAADPRLRGALLQALDPKTP